MKHKQFCFIVILSIPLLLVFACGEGMDSKIAEPTPIKTITTEKDGVAMVFVPAGDFLMGSSDADIELYKEIFPLRDISRFDNERPQRKLYLDEFYIDQFEVTNKQFKQFLTKTGYIPEKYL